ncbi:hypothetical protein [Candidatus Poriferisodalis sp.]|uniref:hypothetical protein n=1 Tax=Candidatus Poriferisodalis sp. TaxID=3101277 RepID=UPI003B518283
MKPSAGKKRASRLVAAVTVSLLLAALIPQAPAGATHDAGRLQYWSQSLSMSPHDRVTTAAPSSPDHYCDVTLKAKWRASGQTHYQVQHSIREGSETHTAPSGDEVSNKPYPTGDPNHSGLSEGWSLWETFGGSAMMEMSNQSHRRTYAFDDPGDGVRMRVRVKFGGSNAWSGWSDRLMWTRGYQVYLADNGHIALDNTLHKNELSRQGCLGRL